MHQLDKKNLIKDLNPGYRFSIQTLTNVKSSHPVGTTASAATILFPHSTYVFVKWGTLFSPSINLEMAVLVKVHIVYVIIYCYKCRERMRCRRRLLIKVRIEYIKAASYQTSVCSNALDPPLIRLLFARIRLLSS